MDLIGAIQRSFEIIVPLSTARSNHKEVQVILDEARKEGTNYIASVSESFKTAESGFAFAKKAQDLCIALASGREEYSDELIHDSIAEMREIAQKGHTDAESIMELFDANRWEFTMIRFNASETFDAIRTKRIQAIESKEDAEAKARSWRDEVPVVGSVMAQAFKSKAKCHSRKAISYEEALQNLEPVERDLDHLRLGMDVVAIHWRWADTELREIDIRVKTLRDDHMFQMKIRALVRDWKEVEREYKLYINALNTLLNNNPQYKPLVDSRRATTLPKDEENGSPTTLPKDDGPGSGATPPNDEGHVSGVTPPKNEGHGSRTTLPKDELGSGTILPKDGHMSRTTLPKDERHGSGTTLPKDDEPGLGRTLPNDEGHGSGVTPPKNEGHGSRTTLPKDGLGSETILPKDGHMSRTTLPKDEPESATNDMGCSTAEPSRLVTPCPTNVDSHSNKNPMPDETGSLFISIPATETTMALIGATRRSFDIIVPLSTARSDHEDVQVILHNIHKGGINYIASVSKSFKTAESGFAFAKRAQDLCTTLFRGRDKCSNELIHDFIAEMQEIAQTAHADAKATSEMFNANRREFTEIRANVSETFKDIETKRMQVIESKEETEANTLSWKEDGPTIIGATAVKSMAGALRYLESAGKDLELLRAEMDTVAEYWSGVNTELNYIDDQAQELRDNRRLQTKIKSLNRDWEGVARDHKGYITALETLLNNNPQYKPLVDSGRAITLPKDDDHKVRSESLNQTTRPEEGKGIIDE